MKKRIIGPVLLAAALCAGPAWAGNRTDTSKKGSLLIFPQITVDPEDSPGSSNTIIEISNDNIKEVWVKCFYVNERKARVDFSFHLTPKATASWDVLTRSGDVPAPVFPSGGAFPVGNDRRGELICFAVDAGFTTQIRFNHLTGTATVVHSDDADATQPRQAFRYNAWAFAAKCSAPFVTCEEGLGQGTPGHLELTGMFDGRSYDACPAYNIANFMPGGARLNGVTTLDNDLAVVSCNQDLRQDYDLHTTKLLFKVWNAHEVDYTGSFVCVDSVAFVALGNAGGDASPITNPENFDFSTLQTANARFTVEGIPSSQCDPRIYGKTETAGLLGVLNSSFSIAPDPDESQELGSTTFAAGMQVGNVWWDPHGPVLSAPTR